MSKNSSLFCPLLHPHLSSSNLYDGEKLCCFISRPSSFIFMAFFIANFVLLFPLIVLILRSSCTDWRRKRSTLSASSSSHIDCLTYHAVLMEIPGAFRSFPYFAGIYTGNLTIVFAGGMFSSFVWYGETCLHLLTCLERYLAVVHPITYMRLRNERGIRIRNVCIGCVWAFCSARVPLFVLKDAFFIMDFCLLVVSILVMAISSLSVLYILIRPVPGEQGGKGLHQTKKKAFFIIMAISGALVLRFTGSFIWTVFFATGKKHLCIIMALVVWFNIPSSLVLLLLYLQRKGKFMCCKKK